MNKIIDEKSLMNKFIIDTELLQVIVNYIAMGSISKGMSWAELQVVLDRLQRLEEVGLPQGDTADKK